MNKWSEIWNKDRNIAEEGVSTLQKLIIADGFDTATGAMEEKDWLDYCEKISKIANIQNSDSIFDVGCGAGAFLYPFYKKGMKVSGIDYSKSLTDIAKSEMKNCVFINDEALNINSDEKFDFVTSNSVFFYFKDYEYAKDVLLKMIKKANKAVIILDVANLETKEDCEKYRRGTKGEEEYKKHYEGLEHLYYSKQWFLDIANNNGCSCEIHNQFMKNYNNAKYRFNVIIKKWNIYEH